MTSHPNRGAPGPGSNPTPEEVRAARAAAGHTQLQASALIFGSLRAWEDYEAGARRMHPAIWAWYLIATDQHPTLQTTPRPPRGA